MSLGHRSHARKTRYNASWDTEKPDGRVFDSMLEASVARDLDILYKSKKIHAVAAQVWFDLFGKNGSKICRHRPDFLVTCNDGTQKILEVKGEESADWRIKKALFEDNYPHLTYIVCKRENVNYGKLIDIPTSQPLQPSNYASDVAQITQYLTK